MSIDAGKLFEYTNVTLSMIGSVFIARRDIRGYMVFIAGFIPATAFAVYYGHWGLLALYVYYLFINCYGFFRWRKYGQD